MKRFLSVVLFTSECALAFLWQSRDFAAAGRILVFYYWSTGCLVLVTGLLALLGAVTMKTRGQFPKEGRVWRAFSWAMLIARVIGLVGLSHQVLAAVYLFGNLICRFGVSAYRDLPEEGA